MVNVRKALTYIQEHGDALERARAEALLAWTPPPADLVASLEQAQSAAGGWPAGLAPEQPAGLAGTAAVLWALLDLGLERHAMAERGLAFLLAQQEKDGAWPPEAAMVLPPWPGQGEPPAEGLRLYATAAVSSLLVAYGRGVEPAAERALDLLLDHQMEGGIFPGFALHTAWCALPLLAARLGLRSGPAQNIVSTLSVEVGRGEWFPSRFAGLLRHLLLAGFGMETPLARLAWEQLLMRQREDGAWESESGPADDIRSTLEVLWCWRKIVVQRQAVL